MTLDATIAADAAARLDWDAVVIGAGPAGGAAAIELAQRGLRVLIIERCAFPRYKVCGACLSSEALSLLDARYRDVLARLPAQTSVAFELAVAGRRTRLALPDGKIVSRECLDSALTAYAVECGADFLPQTDASLGPVTGDSRVVRVRSSTGNAELHAKVVLAANGLTGLGGSDEANLVVVHRASLLGAGCSIENAPSTYESGVIYMAVGDTGYVGQVVLEDGRMNVAAALAPESSKGTDLARHVCRIVDDAGLPAAHLEGAALKGTPRLTRQPAAVWEPRLFRLGDAAGYVEPFTGEGIGWALRAAVAVVPFVLQAQQEWKADIGRGWEWQFHRQIRRRQWPCRMTARLLRCPRLVSATAAILSRAPALSQPIMYVMNRRQYKVTELS